MNISDLISLPLEEAEKLATDNGYSTRITEQDGEAFRVTMDYRTNRVNFRVKDGIVIGSKIG